MIALAGTVRRYGYSLQHILPVLGDVYLDCITTDDVKAYIAGRVQVVGVKPAARRARSS